MKKILVLVIFMMTGFILLGCNLLEDVDQVPVTVESIAIDLSTVEESYEVDKIDLNDIVLLVQMTDGSLREIRLSEGMLSSEDLNLFSTPGEHNVIVQYGGQSVLLSITIVAVDTEPVYVQLRVIYEAGVEEELIDFDTYEEWLESIRGRDGVGIQSVSINAVGELIIVYTDDSSTNVGKVIGNDGREIELNVDETHIQWRYKGETTWTNLVLLETLQGTDGLEVELQASETHIQWRYTTEDVWMDLISLDLLKGISGEAGVGIENAVINEHGDLIITLTDNSEINAGNVFATTPSDIEFNISETHLQWRYTHETEWKNILALSEIQGEILQVVSADIDETGEIVLTFSDGSEVNLGLILAFYTVKFVDVDGKLIDIRVALHGQSIEAIAGPERMGYDFTKWSQDLTSIKTHMTVTPLYDAKMYTITFDSMGGSKIDSLEAAYESPITLEMPTKNGYTFIGWYLDDMYRTPFSEETMPYKGQHLYAKWELATYVITFDSHYDTRINAVEVTHGDTIERLPIPTRFSDLFIGWFDASTDRMVELPLEYDFAEDIVLSAVWETLEAPKIYGVEPITLDIYSSAFDTFDILAGVEAFDSTDGDLTNEILTVGVLGDEPGEYTIVYYVTNSLEQKTSVARVITLTAEIYPTGWYSFERESAETKHRVFAAMERYLLDTMYGGIPVYSSVGHIMFSERVTLSVNNHIPILGYAPLHGAMSEDDTNVTFLSNRVGEAGEYTFRTTLRENPWSLNHWTYNDHVSSEILDLVIDSLYAVDINDTLDSFNIVPSMAAAMPIPQNTQIYDSGVEAATIWRIPLREDLVWTYHPETDTSNFTANHEMINAYDFINTYKLALDEGWFRAVNGGLDFLSGPQTILNAEAYYYGQVTFDEVGLKAIDDYTIEFEFESDMTEFDVIYWLRTFITTPVNFEMMNAYGDQYGMDLYNMAYTGPFYVHDNTWGEHLILKENPNFHTPNRYSITGIEYQILTDPTEIFTAFIDGKLDMATVPTNEYPTYKEDPRLKSLPGGTTFRIMINGLGTPEAQYEQFFTDYVPEPILANNDFKRAMYFAIPREDIANIMGGSAAPQQFLFSESYMVDPSSGLIYRDTPEGQAVGEGLSPETYGYDIDLAKAYWLEALDALVAEGIYAENAIIEIDLFVFTQYMMGNHIKTVFEDTFSADSNPYNISVRVNVEPKSFPEIYFSYIMQGWFDLGVAGISGATMNAASFMDIFTDDNRSGFQMNWGIDTTSANIEVELFNYDTNKYEVQTWSFNALLAALQGEVYIDKGKISLPPPEGSVYGWRAFVNDWEGTMGYVELMDGHLRLNLTDVDVNDNWHIQIIQDTLALGETEERGTIQLEAGETYRITFQARASQVGEFNFILGTFEAYDWLLYYKETLSVTTEWDTYSIEFTLDPDTDDTKLAQLKLEMGMLFAGKEGPQHFDLDNVTMEIMINGVFVDAGLIINGDFTMLEPVYD